MAGSSLAPVITSIHRSRRPVLHAQVVGAPTSAASSTAAAAAQRARVRERSVAVTRSAVSRAPSPGTAVSRASS